MKIYVYFLFALFPFTGLAQNNYVTIMPGSCSSCMGAIELTKEVNNVYVIEEAYKVDSVSLRKKYAFLREARIIFSDSLFKAYSVDGRMSISNAEGSLKCRLDKYTSTVSHYFNQLTNSQDVDTIQYSIPLAKLSISKRVYTNEGLVYLLSKAENCVILFDLLQNKTLDTIYLTNQAKQEAYADFSVGDLKAFAFYNDNIQPNIQDSLCMIQDIDLVNDTLYMSVYNYFFYMDGADTTKKRLSHFQSIALFRDNDYLYSYVPTNIKQRFVDTPVLFWTEPTDIKVVGNEIYSLLSTSFEGQSRGSYYIVGGFNMLQDSLKPEVVLDKTEVSSANFINPLYNKQYCMITKYPDVFNLTTGQRVKLPIYEQQTYKRMGITDYPKFLNYDFRFDGEIFSILYNNTTDNNIYFAQVEKGNNKVLYNKIVPEMNIGYVRKLDPYNNNYVYCYYENDKIIRVKVF